MSPRARQPALDRFRLLAAVLMVCNHTSPLSGVSPGWDFWLTRVLARLAVPFFLMVSGRFLAKSGWRSMGKLLKKCLLLYAAAGLLYLPLNLYNGGYAPAEWLKKLLIDGTFYHLWYFPALILGVPIARGLSRLGRSAALAIAAALYLIGLGGDSWYGLASAFPGPAAFYGAAFTLFDYTRNGLFYVPLFLLLGAYCPRLSQNASAAGLALSLAGMTAEGFWLRWLGWQRHSSMYLTLPLCAVYLFSLLLSVNRGRDRRATSLSMLMYLLHPWCIVAVRVAAKPVQLEWLLIDSGPVHFAAVLALSFAASLAAYALRPIRPDPKARAWREIDLSALSHNARALQEALSPGCRLMAVVKADGYGHGAVPVARCLQKSGVRAFGVATAEEGAALRRAGIRGAILVLGYTPPGAVPFLRRWRLTQTVTDKAHGLALAAQGRPVRVHLALDTGMRRLGVPAEDRAAIARLYRQKNLRVSGVFSHLCVSDSLAPADMAFTLDQLTLFHDTLAWMRASGFDPGLTHIQASGGVLNLPPQPCDLARVGIALYGVGSSRAPVQRRLDLRPVLSLRARIASVRTLRPGETAGYGRAFTAGGATRLATVTIGYADGLPRNLGALGGEALVRGRRCPVAGRVCMDQLLLVVTGVPEAAAGDVVTLIGRDGEQEITAEELAETCRTITNELLSRLGSRTGLVVHPPDLDQNPD